MAYTVWLSLVLLGCLSVYAEEDTCSVEQDPTVYLFGYGYDWGQYEFLNDDGELMGLGYDLTRSICKVMNKKCEHAVYYDYSYAYNAQGVSISLNDGWYTALVNWLPNPERLSSYSFCLPYAKEPAAYMYVRRRSRIDNVDEVKSDADRYGFRTGFRTSPECLGNFIGMSLSGKENFYEDEAAMEDALRRSEVDVIFVDADNILDASSVKRIEAGPIRCATGGLTIMTRKDVDVSWFGDGLEKIKANGDYGWICNMNGDPGCYL